MVQQNDEQGVKWYAVHVRSNQERTTETFLADRNVTAFLPTYRVQSKRSDRRTTLTRPLFSGYIFVHIDYNTQDRIQVLKAPGFVRIVGFGQKPTPVPDATVQSLEILVGASENQVRPHPLVRAGSFVEVVSGPFKGATGLLHEKSGRKAHLVVEIEFLGRAVSVPILPDQVQPIVG